MDVRSYSREVQLLIGEIQKNRGKDSGTVLSACDKLLAYGKGMKDDALIGYAYFSKGETYYLLNDASNFYSQMLSCMGPMEHVKEWGYVAMANNMLGIVSLNRGNAPFALDYFIKAISICEDYSLPDIEWMIHMNLGSLYLNIEEYQKSISHTEIAYRYILDHKSLDGFTESYTAILLGMGRAYLNLDREDRCLEIEKKLRTDCLPYLMEMDRIVIYCYFARVHQAIGEDEARDYWIEMVNKHASTSMPILDVFDDFYDYLHMLLKIEKYDDFFKAYTVLDDLTKHTSIKNLERKLLTLKIRYYRRVGQIEEYKIASVLYFELSEFMERENRLMVSNMIVMRNSYMELTQINKKVEEKNTFLQKRSETDPLTGMYNRLKLNEYSEEAFEKALINRSSIAVEILDIDFFKQYNDNYGHQEGDNCIKFIASTLIEMAKEDGIFTARYGGDEFVVIYEGLTKEMVEAKANELRDRIYQQKWEHKFSLTDNIVTISQGICYGIPERDASMFGYLQGADKMLYEVKQQSRNAIKICDATDLVELEDE
ncbi:MULTISPECIES: tetratricopeptide repeat-containing diguanylate cyclase [unclassified Pseudobutyrivibrio]|uniref:tetratricopeptide repeat-containing diguanylate cyclase n=1 Tax=unclassified Pseudobutyrivibrio TaxID=2638619 RepID=UPI000678F217|nr:MULTISPECIES: GGDEF domain-containing protein [unclassified Pseudobutyrivibrio]SET29058.1 diguanylate cyclase (GGDEF) domain-containing protein [Pseudobutyrivibrio sp. C4]SFO51800.1 diguanylate cyclase (GGDEF) domain-containing protein [Pseudobutyrivibrio sp. JW11]